MRTIFPFYAGTDALRRDASFAMSQSSVLERLRSSARAMARNAAALPVERVT